MRTPDPAGWPARAVEIAQQRAAQCVPGPLAPAAVGSPGEAHDEAPPDRCADAFIAGNRAGVVEWVNPAWTEITGFPLAETLHKPIAHFLDFAGIEIDLVDFVGQQFLAGQRCSVEFPFETPAGRPIQIHLEVEPIRNPEGEVAEFLATAREIDIERPQSEPAPPAHSRASSVDGPRAAHGGPARCAARLAAVTASRPVSLSARAREAAVRRLATLDPRTMLDLSLDPKLPMLEADPRRTDALLDELLTAASRGTTGSWTCITLMTGHSRANSGHVSRAHPITARPWALTTSDGLYLEVHDTGAPLSRDALMRIRQEQPGMCARETALAEASRLARSLGATLHLDSTPGCGTQALVLFSA